MFGLLSYHVLTLLGAPALDIQGVPNRGGNETTLLQGLLNTVYATAGIVAVIVIIIAGYIYVTSDGDAARVKQAKNAIIYAVVGLVVIILAFSITAFISAQATTGNGFSYIGGRYV